MKTNYFLLVIAFLCFLTTAAQIVNIPDASFKSVLVNSNVTDSNGDGSLDANVDLNNDGEIQNTEAQLISNLQLPSFQNITSLEGLQAFTNLITFNAGDNDIINVPLLSAAQLTDLILEFNNVTSLDTSLLGNLKRLDVEQNQLNSIVLASNGSLEEINLFNNNLSNINLNNNVNLEKLFISDNPLTSLDLTNCPNLTHLDISNSLIPQLDIANQLIIEDYNISNLPLTTLIGTTGKVNLNRINITNTLVSTLDFSNCNSTGSFITIFGNLQLTSINLDQTTNLDIQVQNNTQLDALTGQNNNGTSLYFNNNGLKIIDFENNPIINPVWIYNESQLDVVNLNYSNFGSLRLVDTNIDHLLIKNSRSDVFDFIGNIDINYICPDSFELSNVNSTLISNNITNVNINTYCNFAPADFRNVIGEIRLDMDLNGCSTSDLTLLPIKFTVVTGGDVNHFYQTPAYDYQLSLPFGNHSITAAPLASSFFQPVSSFNASFGFNSSDRVQDICFTPNGNQVDLAVILDEIVPARPGFTPGYRLICSNLGTAAMNGTVFLNYDDSRTHYITSTVAPINNTSGNLSWDVPILQPGQQYIIEVNFRINSPMDTPAVNGGDVLVYNGNIAPPSGITDVDNSNNTFEFAQTVVNSFDPNDITCLEGAILDPTNVGQDLHYKIRFENTGTASAINIVVKNTLDTSKLDINSFQPLISSHPMRTRITDGNVVEFIFENINLDFNDATNDGYLIYKIQSLSSLQLGDMIGNQAEIYFDFNFPIITNDYMVTVDQTAGLSDLNQNSISLFPNPSNGKVTINSSSYIQAIQVFDYLGRKVKSILGDYGSLEVNIDISMLNTGLYFIKVKNESGEQSLKLIKK